MSKLNILHVVSGLRPEDGGPSRTVTELTDALAEHDELDVKLITQGYINNKVINSENPKLIRNISESNSKFALCMGLPILFSLHKIVKNHKPQIIHDHGLWLPSNYWSAYISQAFNIHLVIQPRGMLEPWAVNHKLFKKKIAMKFYQRHNLNVAKLLIATASSEYENLRALGFKNPIAIIPNGVKVKTDCKKIIQNSDEKCKVRVALFLSRIHVKKGLINLIEAWASIRPLGWILKIAGPDEGGYLEEVRLRISQLGIGNSIQYVGEANDEYKSQLYSEADLFVLPTFSENFGLVIAEALSYGIPVITTKAAPWKEIEIYGCGWWIDIGVNPLILALREALELSDEKRKLMGSIGREYVRRFNWDEIANKTIDAYYWVINGGPKPDCIELN